jgi:pyruvate kinase
MTAGLNVARINFSHGTHETHAATIALVREIAAELERPVAILGDLQGPRIRVGVLPQPVMLEEGADIVLAPEATARAGEIPTTYDALCNDVHVGDRILMDDGLIDVIVLEVDRVRVRARVLHGGLLRSNEGMNLPGVAVSAPTVTGKDHQDITFAVEQEVDYLALSFVRKAEDIATVRALVPRTMLVVAKIEKDTALQNIDSIVRASDGIMVARGDLGVELPYEEVPMAQKRIIELCNALGRPVITATQMLESMVNNPRPTRAEASDVANAILDGTDAVMLSAETAVGAYAPLAVHAMTRIISHIEQRGERRSVTPVLTRSLDGKVPTEDAIAAATAAAVRMMGTPVVIVFTKSGFTARVIASHRPPVPIVALTDEPRTFQQLALVWGVIPTLVPSARTYDEMFAQAARAVLERGLARTGDRVLVTAGVPFDVPGTTNLLKVEVV